MDSMTPRQGDARPERPAHVHDVVGVGFGPAGIALAAAIHDAEEFLPPEAPRMDVLFVERAPSSKWQPDMLLMDTQIRHHFLRDFATPRNPRSRLTFPNYLKEVGRLYAFGNYAAEVSRIEWSDYVEWTAKQVNRPVLYRHEVTSVWPVADNGRFPLLGVEIRDLRTGDLREVLTRNLLVSTGHVPYAPPQFERLLGPRVFHSHYFKRHVDQLEDRPGLSIAVIGAGQNSAEACAYLLSNFPSATVYSLIRHSGFRLLDVGHFGHQVYWPEETDYVYGLPKTAREQQFQDVRLTNYSAIDEEVSGWLYRYMYQKRIMGQEPFRVINRTEIVEVQEDAGRYRLRLRQRHTGEESELEADVVVLCTGFTEPRIPGVIERLAPYLELDEDGDPLVSRRFRLATKPSVQARVYLSGVTEWRHGINSATAFSTMALRAQELLDDINSADAEPPAAGAGPQAAESARAELEATEIAEAPAAVGEPG